MDRRDPFPRRTASPAVLAPWIAELVRTADALVATYVPGGPLDARTREDVILAVTEVNGCRYCAWIHEGWRDALGDADAPEEALLAYAQACAEAGRPLDPSVLGDAVPPGAHRAVRATVAQIQVANLVGNTADGLLARLTRARPLATSATLVDAATVALAVPVAVPMLAVGGALRALGRRAPALPEVEMPPAGEANLLVHLLAQAIPSYLGHAGVRLVVLGAPVRVRVGLRAGRTTATITLGRGRVALANGIQHGAVAVVEGEVEPLLRAATGALVHELRSIRIRPS